jgi:Mn-dependent DtxR family transcriptional regulator
MPKPKPPLTPREEFTLYVVAAWREDNNESPTRQDIADVMGVTPGRATQLVHALEAKGMLERPRYKHRGIQLTVEGWLKANRGRT